MTQPNSATNINKQLNVTEEVGEKDINHLDVDYSALGPFRSESRDIGIFTFILISVFILLNAFEVMYLLSKDLDILAINIAFLTTVIPRIIFYIVFGIKYAGLKKFAKYLIILDPIAFPMAVSAYAYVIFLTSIFVLSAFDIVNIVLLVILFIVYSAFHRALVMEAIWRKWQIIIYKIMLVIAGGMYIVYGIRYIFPGINWTGGQDEDLDESIKQFIILFIIACADFVVKMFEKMCDLDKSADLHIQENDCNSQLAMKRED